MDDTSNLKNSLFILGAGSSASYGYPTGNELKHLLLSESLKDFYKRAFNVSGFDDSKYINSDGVISNTFRATLWEK